MSFASKITASRHAVFMVLTQFSGDQSAWYFVRVQPGKTSAFRKAVASGPTNLKEYGEILKSGWGKKPPQKVINEMKEVYGYIPE